MPSYVQKSFVDSRAMVLQELSAIKNSGLTPHPSMVESLRRIVPFDGFAFSGLDIEGCRVGAGVFLGTDLPQAMIKTYVDEQLLEADPLARLLTEQTPLVQWDQVQSDDLRDSKTKRLIETLKRFGVAPRTAIGFWRQGRCYGGVTFTRKKAFSDGELATLQLFAAPIHEQMARPVIAAVNQRLGLSAGEIRCLKWAANGLTSEEIASATSYTVETVSAYLKAAIHKLKAENRSHAIAEALRRKIID